MKNIEKKTAQAILEKTTEIQIAGQTYNVTPPTLGTLILLSEQITNIPFQDFEKSDSLYDFFKLAPYSQNIAKGLAVMILGSEKILFNKEKTPLRQTFWQKIKRKFIKNTLDKHTNEIDILSGKIIHQMEISQMIITFTNLLSQTNIADFLTLITFLQDVNVLKPTRQVIQTTAFGQ